MPVVAAHDANGVLIYFEVAGAGTQADPFKTLHSDIATQTLLDLLLDRFPVALANGKFIVETGNITIDNLPITQAVTGAFYPATQPISGLVEVSNLPTTQPISGNVAITNLPATQPVSGTFYPATQPISGNVGVTNFPTSFQITNFPATQSISGNVGITNFPISFSVSNFPITQAISGNVGVSNFPISFSISNFPATQPISAAALPLPSGAATEDTVALIPTRIGNLSDAAATNDIGSFSLISFFKRLLSLKLPASLSGDRFKVESQLISTGRVTSFINTSAAGTIAAGANSIAIANSGTVAGTVKGISLPAGTAINFWVNGNDVINEEIAYSATGTTFLITTVV